MRCPSGEKMKCYGNNLDSRVKETIKSADVYPSIRLTKAILDLIEYEIVPEAIKKWEKSV